MCSYLSSERMWHEKHSGLYNLAAVIMVVTNFRLGLEVSLTTLIRGSLYIYINWLEEGVWIFM